jgi:hypothetical protein
MSADQVLRRMAELETAGIKAQQTALQGIRSALKGHRVPGHRIGMSERVIRVQGPYAPSVARQVSQKGGKAAQKALRRELI